jgi:acylphosphatase
MERLHARVRGKVQGVWYRAWCRETATELGLTGWVRNMPDGAVEVLAEGPKERLTELETRLHRGPEHARVSGVASEYTAATGEFTEFAVDRAS